MIELEKLLSAAVECGDEPALKAFTKASERAYSKLAQIECERKRVEEQKLVGRMFKQRKSVGDGVSYAIVIGFIKDPYNIANDSGYLGAFTFKRDLLNNIEISYRDSCYFNNNDNDDEALKWVEIDTIEFDLAWHALVKLLPDMPRTLVK